jgi:pantoate--beta-alanine ligase
MIKIFKTLNEFQTYRQELSNESIGLVPTMGNLHAGHISLAKKSFAENDITIATIFVNPKQFGPNEDFDKYPRTLDNDIKELALALESYPDKELIIFAPENSSEIYPKDFTTIISLGDFTNRLCGKSRPGHFDGVTTVVYRLFAIAKAKNAYFGQKDYQQFLTIKKMVDDLSYPINLNMVEIARDESGLALSSRNQYLSIAQKEEALILNKTLSKIAKELTLSTWIAAVGEINKIQESTLFDQSWEYLEVLDANNLSPVELSTTQVIILGAYQLGTTRLIDNLIVDITYA